MFWDYWKRREIKPCSRLEQRSVIKFLPAKKRKPDSWMCDVYEETCFTQKKVYKLVKHVFTTTSLSRKNSTLSENRAQRSVKKVKLTVPRDMKGPNTIDFIEKVETVNSASYCNILTLDRPVNQEMHLCKYAEEQQKQVEVGQLYNQVPEAVRASWSQLGTRCRIEIQRQK